MKTYVIQLKTPNGTKTNICQADNITEALKFIMKKYEETMGKIEFIYSEEYHEKNTDNNI